VASAALTTAKNSSMSTDGSDEMARSG
jgi:hypothetical protein